MNPINAINIAYMESWWLSAHGDTKGGTFNLELYLDYLRIKNNK